MTSHPCHLAGKYEGIHACKSKHYISQPVWVTFITCAFASRSISFTRYPDQTGEQITMRESAMKSISKLCAGTALLMGASLANADEAIEVKTTVMQIPNVVGTLQLAVYDSHEDFQSWSNPIFTTEQKVSSNTESLVLSLPKAGKYAITYFIDENDSKQIDMRPSGMPAEPYGFSNNCGVMGPPSFDACAIELDADSSLTLITNSMP
jgi:uncharacterized protein (DUF2141 family)